MLLEQNQQTKLNEQEQFTKMPLTLTPENSEIIDNLCEIIWHNPKLELLNLSNTGLIQPALHKLAQALKYGLAIKSLRMSGNLSLKGDLKMVALVGNCSVFERPLPVRNWNE